MSEILDPLEFQKRQFRGKHLQVKEEMKKIVRFFLSNPKTKNLTFRGFILDGEPATGKTELVRQMSRDIAYEFRDKPPASQRKIEFAFVDSSHIAAARFGEAEKNIRKIFEPPSKGEIARIVLFDDIDCIMIKRGQSISREWHYSMNSVMFHQLDNIDPTKIIFIGTTNRADLLDDALYSRLILYKIPRFSLEQLKKIVDELVEEMEIGLEDLSLLKDKVKSELDLINSDEFHPDIRVVQNIITKTLINTLVSVK